jgi:prepilin-type processing-associated H-X9-DG protein
MHYDARGAYGYNGYCYSDLSAAGKRALAFPKDSSLIVPSRTPYFADSVWVDSWPKPTDTLPSPANLYFGNESPGEGLGRFMIARHGGNGAATAPRAFTGGQAQVPGRNSVGYADGHAERTKLRDYWTLMWSQAWPR